MGLGQYNSLGEYCGLNTASSVFLILKLMAVDRGAKGSSAPAPAVFFVEKVRTFLSKMIGIGANIRT